MTDGKHADPGTELHTVRRRVATLPIRVLKVEVIAGPDAGKTAVAKTECLTIGTAKDNDLVLTDPTVSRCHVELRPRDAGVQVVDHGSTNGVDVAGLRVDRAVVPAGTVITLGDSRVRVADGGNANLELYAGDSLGGILGRTPAMRQLMARVAKAAQTDAPVLLLGESGTGKEVIARALFGESRRSTGPFVTVDCGALSPTLIASELFGHERGAFTGATHQHQGAFERASGGTVFLDEIGELPLSLQANLLGVLERRSLRRVGGDKEIPINVRVLSATHHDLYADVNAGTFRLDLYYRLAVVVLKVPALREHNGDIPLLVEHFLRAAGHPGGIEDLGGAETLEAWGNHSWPGNVRELRNLVEARLATGDSSHAVLLPPPSGSTLAPGGIAAQVADLPYKEARATVLQQFEAHYLKALMARAGDNISQAARAAGVDRGYLSDLLRRHKIK